MKNLLKIVIFPNGTRRDDVSAMPRFTTAAAAYRQVTHLAVVVSLSSFLMACTADEIGQTLYNSIKVHCDNQPENCGY